MHMSDALLSIAVGGTMAVATTVAIGYSIKKIKDVELEDKKIPMMGVMGAFVFAAQMINFTIPITGSSGHIGGGILLAALLGPYPALITLASVLLIQCLLFADGGLLALGCNIFNMGVISCLFVYPLIYKPFLKKGMTPKRITIASILSVVVGLQLGSLGVVLETSASGITELPFGAFISLMQPIHLAIGLVEGVVTASVLCFIYHIRKEILDSAQNVTSMGSVSIKKVILIMLAATALIGGGLSLYASTSPDGLEWSIEGVAGTTKLENDSSVHEAAENLQESTAILPNYSLDGDNADNSIGTSLSGIVGGLVTMGVAVLAGILIVFYKKKKLSRVSINKE
jgi:cobalt/nickel transport system permease protein